MRLAKPEDGPAFITGASTGIGRALAIRLAAAGWTVVAGACGAADLDEVASAGVAGRIHPWPLDVTDAAAVNRAIAGIEARLGAVALGVLPEAAAEAYYRGLQSGRFEIVFPRPMAWAMKIYRCLPYVLAMALARRLIPKDPPESKPLA